MKMNRTLEPVADPGFPRRRGTNPQDGEKTYYLAKFLPKTA